VRIGGRLEPAVPSFWAKQAAAVDA
jgi:hypothetical protein